MKDGERQMETYRKIRKPMPPMEKVIKPKVEFKRERFDWRKAIEDNDEDYSIKGGKNA
jgi:hypothetical protein